MKIIALTLIASATLAACSYAQNQGFSPHVAGHEAQANDTAIVYLKAMQHLKTEQRPNGSWGGGQSQFRSTALVLSAFLRSGETRSSPMYGESILKARDWLLTSEPAATNDRLAVLVALADYYTLHRDPESARKVADILGKTGEPQGNDTIWGDLLAAVRLPDEAIRPQWCLSPTAVKEKYRSLVCSNALEDIDAYLQAYLVARSKILMRLSTTKEQNIFIKGQKNDGSVAVLNADDEIAATALFVLLSDLHHQGAPQFHVRETPAKATGKPESGSQELKVDVQ